MTERPQMYVCPTCGRLLSENARTCPRCGEPEAGAKAKCHYNTVIVPGAELRRLREKADEPRRQRLAQEKAAADQRRRALLDAKRFWVGMIGTIPGCLYGGFFLWKAVPSGNLKFILEAFGFAMGLIAAGFILMRKRYDSYLRNNY